MSGERYLPAVIDQEARDLARQAVAILHQHAAVCLEREKRQELQWAESEKRRATFESQSEAWIKNMQHAYEEGLTGLKASLAQSLDETRKSFDGRMAALVDRMNNSESSTDKKLIQQADTNKDLYGRFWAALIAVASIEGAAVGFLLLHPIQMFK